MPELPEVETIKCQLLKQIKNKKIESCEVRSPRVINVAKNDFKKKIIGAVIKDIKRRAKLLIIGLSNDWSLVIHLKLTGQLLYHKSKIKKLKLKDEKYTHLIFYFTDGSSLFYNDRRQFGYIKLIKTKEVPQFLAKENFGPEPLEKGFTLNAFKILLNKKPRLKIKPLLMDQSFLAGIGNVYAQEICFYAKVNPNRIVSTLLDKEINELYQGIKKILLAAIFYKGSSVDTYLDIYGLKGKYIPFLKVYNREGKECLRCGTKIKKITLGGRGTCFCPNCQK